MLNIIRADFYRIIRGKALYITFGVLIAFIVIQAIAGTGTVGVNTDPVLDVSEAEMVANALDEAAEITRADGITAPFVMAGATGNLVYFLLPLIICLAGVDFSSGTVKNVLSRGVSRTKYYFAKLIPILFFAVIIQVLNLVLPIIVATVRHGFGGDFTTDWLISVLKVYGIQTLLMLAIACAGVFIVFLTQKTASINALFLAFLLVPTMIFYILGMISTKLQNLVNYDLVTNLNLMAGFSELPSGDIIRAFLLGAFYIIVGTVAGLAIFRKSDLK